MSDKPQGIKEGPPIWVESLMTRPEWRERKRKYKTSIIDEPVEYDASYHKGGKWRQGMGYSLSLEEIRNINSNLEYLKSLAKT